MGVVQIKRRLTGGAAGAPASLMSGELAWNGTEQVLRYGEGDNGSGVATSIISIAGLGAFVSAASSQSVSGVKSFTTSPTVPTLNVGTSTEQAASTAFVQAALDALIDSAPGTLDTLNELASALGDDPNFAATINASIATKAPLASPALTGNPTAPTQATGNSTTRLATTAFVQQELGAGTGSIDGGTY